MAKDDRDILEVLKAELDFVDQGGYGRSVRTPWKPNSIFQDSPTCINFCDPNKTRPCSECLLMEFVPPEDQIDQEEALRMWLCTAISRIERLRDE